MNHDKTELMIDGGNNLLCREMARRVGITQGALPVRYLGVPLSAKKKDKSDFQPLLDKVTARFRSWTVKHLSFSGPDCSDQSCYLLDYFVVGDYFCPPQRLCHCFGADV